MSDDPLIEDAEPTACECVYSDSETDDDEDNLKAKPRGSKFTHKEDLAIIHYLANNKRYLLTGGNIVWKEAAEYNICPGRSHQSLKERFRRHILPRLGSYEISEDIKGKLKKDVNNVENDEKEKLAEINQKEFSKEEDTTLIDFFIENDKFFKTDGHKLWKLAEEKKICPGRSFWSMRERFLRCIVPNIESYECDNKSKKKIKKAANERYGQISEMPRNYIMEEDIAIIKFVTHDDNYLKVNGLRIWHDAEEEQICPGRTYHSMKERLRRVILLNLNRYVLDESQKEKLFFLANASSKEIALKRRGFQIEKVFKNPRNSQNDCDSAVPTVTAVPTESPYFTRAARFHYPSIADQKTLESPMRRLSEISSIQEKPSPNSSKIENHRNKSPEPCCSKDLSPTGKSKNLGKRIAVNSSPEKTDESISEKRSESPVQVMICDESESPVQVMETENEPEQMALETVKDNRGMKSQKYIPFFEEMKKDEGKKKLVTSTPRKVPDKSPLNIPTLKSNEKQNTKNNNVKTSKTKPSKKKKQYDAIAKSLIVKKLHSVKGKG